MAGATLLIAGASGTTPNSGVRFLCEFFIIVDAFALGQVLNFRILAYVADCYGEFHPLNGVASVGNELPVPPPLPGLLGVYLEVLALQIQCSLGPHPIVSDQCQMSYMLANIHH